jgi:hypothetical protein
MKRIIMVALSCLTTVLTSVSASPAQNLQGTNMPITRLLVQKENCQKYDRKFEPSPENKTVELKRFGIKVQVPKNYRTLLSSKGEVWILNSVDYDLLACFARGGKGGGRGMYYSFFRSHANKGNLSLQEFVRKQYGANASIQPYLFSGFKGLLAEESPLDRGLVSSSYFLQIPGIENIIEISAGCDCDIKADNIKSFLKLVNLL